MTLFPGMTRRMRALFRRAAVERDLDDEIRLHLDLETERLVRSGLSLEAARRRARIAFGSVPAAQEAYREGWGFVWLRDLTADVRYALRMLRRAPGLATAAILTIALAIGANTAIFSAVDGVILRPLPFPNAGRLAMLWESNPEYHWDRQDAAAANMLDWAAGVPAFADVAAFEDYVASMTLTGTGDGRPRLLSVAKVTGNFFSVLGVRAELGRTLRPEETWGDAETWNSGVPHVVVISDALWRDQFAAAPSIVGRSVRLNGRTVQVVGVAPATLRFPFEHVDAWAPVAWDPAIRGQTFFRRAHWVRPIALLAPGTSPGAANAELQTVVRRLQREYPATNRVMGAGLTPLHAFLTRDSRRPLLMLLAAVALVLLIACANVGNLLLVQAAGREREAAMRLALGAGRGRLVRQALTESLVLSGLGGVVGLAIGWWGTRVLAALQPAGMIPAEDVRMNWVVLAYVAAVSAACGILFGVAPALWSGRRVPAEVLKEGGRGGSGGGRVRRVGDTLISLEVAVALVLAVGAGLLVRSFWRLTQVDPGFDAHGVLAVQINASGPKYDSSSAAVAFFDELARQARGLPGVDAAALTSQPPLTGFGYTSQFVAEGWPSGRFGAEVAHIRVGPGYFRAMGIPLVRGRDFTPRDRPGAPPVVLINRRVARTYFPDRDPIGQRVAFDKAPDSASTWYTIVGVVGDTRQTQLGDEVKAQFYEPLAQEPSSGMYLVLRTAGDPSVLGAGVRRLVGTLDPDLAIRSMQTMDEVRATSLAAQRFFMTMLLAFASVGLALAIVGVYGVIAQLARHRTRELGIRIALGATTRAACWVVVRHGLVFVVVGLALGVGIAFATTWAMRSFLYGVAPADPVTFVAVSVVLLSTAAAATWIPALRASRADPATTLRAE